jgi:hypothetical protein
VFLPPRIRYGAALPSYSPASLSAVPDGRLTQLVQAAKQRRLVLYLGAGISMAPPSCGPKGTAVGDKLRPLVAKTLGVTEQALAGLTLEGLAQRVVDADPGKLAELKELAAVAFDFRGIVPNYGHTGAALLLREGLAELISVNWDCGVERAGLDARIEIQGVANAAESIQIVTPNLPLYKIHGCATRPRTLAISQADVDEPQRWAAGRTQSAVVGGVVAFVGLGTIGLYVKEPIPEVVATWASEANIMVVDPQLQDSWRRALGDEKAKQVHLAREADEFFDELLRAVVLDAIRATEMAARDLAEHEDWAKAMLAGFIAIRDALDGAQADSVMRWWRDGVNPNKAGKQFITEAEGRKCLMTVGALAALDGGPLAVSGSRGRLTVASDFRYYEIVCEPEKHVSRVEVIARERIDLRRSEGVYLDDRSVTVVTAGEMGRFPASSAPFNIAAGDEDGTDVASGVESSHVTFVSSDDGIRGKLAA